MLKFNVIGKPGGMFSKLLCKVLSLTKGSVIELGLTYESQIYTRTFVQLMKADVLI